MTYTIAQIKKAFWQNFHGCGDQNFEYSLSEEENQASTEQYWMEFESCLGQAATPTSDRSFSPELLQEGATAIEALRVSLDATDDAGSSAEAEQYFRLALSALKQAESFLTLAQMNQSQALKTWSR